MIVYVDQQDNVTEKANLVAASRFSSLPSLTTEKQHMFGRLFSQTYNSDNQHSELAKKIIWLGLSEMKTPLTKVMPSTKFFQKTNYSINQNLRKVSHP